MPKHEPEVVRSIAKSLVSSMDDGERLWNSGQPMWCHRAMRACTKNIYDDGICDCARWDAVSKMNGSRLV